MKVSLRNRIVKYLQAQGKPIHGGDIERLAESVGYKGSTASRRCRELADEEIIIADYSKKGHVWYSAEPRKKEEHRIEIINGRPVAMKIC